MNKSTINYFSNLFDELQSSMNKGACDQCSTKFTVFKRKRKCGTCNRYYCTNCLLPSGGNGSSSSSVLSRFSDRRLMCKKCRILATRPLNKSLLQQLRSRDLQFYLSLQNVSTKGCVEKEDLINLVMQHVNGPNTRSNVNSPTTGFHSQSDLLDSDDQRPSSSDTRRPSSLHEFPMAEYSVTCADSSSTSEDASPVTEKNKEKNSNAKDELQDFEIVELSDWVGEENSSELEVKPVVMIAEDSTPEEVSINSEKSGSTTTMACTGITLADFNSVDDLEKLSVKQIKELLALNRVDYRGCCERKELMERLVRLWNANSAEKKELETSAMGDICKICMDAPVECVMLECGHMAACTTCGKQLNECPICRQYVVRVVRIFRA